MQRFLQTIRKDLMMLVEKLADLECQSNESSLLAAS